MLKFNFYFAAKMGNQRHHRQVNPRILAVKLADYPHRAFSMSRWLEVRAIMEAAT